MTSSTPRAPSTHYRAPARVLHWLMAAMVLAMLFIGVGLVASVSARHPWLLALHEPLGALVLVLALVRLGYRLRHPPPALPPTVAPLERFAVKSTNALFYALLIAQPLVGLALVLAAGGPLVLGPIRPPAWLAPNATLFALLREAHSLLAFGLFALVLAHLGAVLFHALVHRDGILSSMAFGEGTRERPPASSPSNPP